MAIKSSKKQKKTWFDIVAPKEFGNYILGQTPALEPQKVIGRKVQVSLMSVLNDPKKQNIQVVFKIKSVRDKNAVTEIVRYSLVSSYVKRIMRKRRDKIDDSFVAESKDKVKIRVKPIMITRAKTQRSKRALVRQTAKDFIIEKLRNQNFVEFINDAVSTKTQREMKEKLKKFYPIAVCEFRVIQKL